MEVGSPTQRQRSSGRLEMSKAPGDTFYLYGGPGSVLGKFQQSLEHPGGACDEQNWTEHDLTRLSSRWRVIALDASGGAHDAELTGGYAAAAHHDDVDYVGYGNDWSDPLTWELGVGYVRDHASEPTTVGISFDYAHALEPGYDELRLSWHRLNVYETLLRADGSSFVDSTGAYAARSFAATVEHLGDDYSTDGYGFGAYIRFRVEIETDGMGSDEDGLWVSHGRGAAAIDNIVVSIDGVPYSQASWEDLGGGCAAHCAEGEIANHASGAAAGTRGWVTSRFAAGEFSKQFSLFQDIDPCRQNITCQWSFIDDGRWIHQFGPLVPGTTSSAWAYGVPGGFVVNHHGGYSLGDASVHNQIWSPEIAWDLPGSDDDDAHGAITRFDWWGHLPAGTGIFAQWQVRSFTEADGWTEWRDHDLGYMSAIPRYLSHDWDVTDLLHPSREKLQVALGVIDLAELFELPGTDATPSPLYDNVAVKKYTFDGPRITTQTFRLAQDAFPQDGTTSGSARFDAAMDIGPRGGAILPGDSITVDILSVTPGIGLQDPLHGGVMRVAMAANPHFGGATTGPRSAALAALGAEWVGSDARGWPIYTFEVQGLPANSNGEIVENRYFFDLLDGPANPRAPHQSAEHSLLFPGDVVHYYVEASDTAGLVTTLPWQTAGFLDFSPSTAFSRVWTMRVLPTAARGHQPSVLVWNDFGHRGGEEELTTAFLYLGWEEGYDFDTYTTKAPTTQQSNGLGSDDPSGTRAEQFAGYDTIIYVCGDLRSNLISDGSGAGLNDKANDLGVLSAWFAADAPRYLAAFGDNLAEGLASQGAGTQAFLSETLGVSLLSLDARTHIDGQTAPVIRPTATPGGCFAESFAAYGGCPSPLSDFDRVGPANGVVQISHEFTRIQGDSYDPPVAAGLWWEREEDGFLKGTAFLPFEFSRIYTLYDDPGCSMAARACLLRSLLDCWGKTGLASGDATAALRFALEQNSPNPFNPRTEIRLTSPANGRLSLRIYNVRGELVRVLHDGEVPAGKNRFAWDGTDRNGAKVASGVYLYEAAGFDRREVRKMAIIR